MEEEFIEMFENDTMYDYYEYVRPLHSYIYESLELVACIAGMLADVVAVYAFCRNRQIRNRIDVVMINWFANDLFFLLSQTYFVGALLELGLPKVQQDRVMICVDRCAELCCQFACLVLASLLTSDYLIKTDKVGTSFILRAMYLGLISFGMGGFANCMSYKFFWLLDVVVLVFVINLFLTVSFQDVSICCKRSTAKMDVRTNFVRIYFYNWFAAFVLAVLDIFASRSIAMVLRFGHITVYLTSCYIFAYMYKTDKAFRNSVMNVFGKGTNNYDFERGLIEDAEEQECRINVDLNSSDNNSKL